MMRSGQASASACFQAGGGAGFLSDPPWSPAPAVPQPPALLSSSRLSCASILLQFPGGRSKPPPQPPPPEQMACLLRSGEEKPLAGTPGPSPSSCTRLHPGPVSSPRPVSQAEVAAQPLCFLLLSCPLPHCPSTLCSCLYLFLLQSIYSRKRGCRLCLCVPLDLISSPTAL